MSTHRSVDGGGAERLPAALPDVATQGLPRVDYRFDITHPAIRELKRTIETTLARLEDLPRFRLQGEPEGEPVTVPWTIVPEVFGISGARGNEERMRACQHQGTAWLNRYEQLLTEVNAHLPRRAGELVQSELENAVLAAIRALDESPGEHLLQRMLYTDSGVGAMRAVARTLGGYLPNSPR